MALKWKGNRAETENTVYFIEKATVRVRDEDGRTPIEAERYQLWRRILYNSGLWSKTALVSNFKTEAEAKAYAEDF